MMLTLVIPSYQRTAYVRDTLADLARQTVRAYECLLILQAAPTAVEVTELHSAMPGRLRVLHVAEPNASLARNIGLAEAEGEVVLFLDDDVRLPDPGFLAAHLRNFEDPTVSGVYGQVLERGQAPTEQPAPALIETDGGWRRLPPNYAQRCRTRNGASNNLAVRREWALAVGGMDAWFERGARREETEFNLRYTKRFGPLVFDPKASLVHLSAGGGSRHWGHVRRVVPMHHVVGHWYLLLAAIRDRTMGPLEAMHELRTIATALLRNPRTGADPFAFTRNLVRAVWGLGIAARRVLAGPRRLDTTPMPEYELLPPEDDEISAGHRAKA